jgi:hypothetical protein
MEIQTLIDEYQQYGLPNDPEILASMSIALAAANNAAGQVNHNTLDLPLLELVAQDLALYHEIIVAIGVKLENLYEAAK